MKHFFPMMLATAVMVVAASCKKDEGGGTQYGDLQIFWGSEKYEVAAGSSVTMPFTVVGAQEMALTVTATTSESGLECTRKWNADYTGHVTVTAPTLVETERTVTVTVTAEDKANNRKTSESVPLKLKNSEPLKVAFATDIKSMAVKAGGSFSIPFVVTGLLDATVSSKNLLLTPGSWTGITSLDEEGDGGLITVFAPAAVTSALEIKLDITDSYGRTASLDNVISIVEITEVEGASNCHIVKPGSTVTIKAVKGGSAQKVEFDNAVLLWQDEKGLVKSVAGNGTEGVVVVTLNEGISGNSLVAARSIDKVVWSWHLWVTDFDPDEDPFTYVDSTSLGNPSYTFMNRDLGALSDKKYDKEALGLFYQWGRKDPFSRADGLESSAQKTIFDIDGNTVYMTVAERPVYGDHKTTNLQLAIENPMTFYTAPSSAWPVVDWLTDDASLQDNDLWGNVSDTKTIYDPCPEGWEIPVLSMFSFRKRYSKEGKLTDANPYDPAYPWYIDQEDQYTLGFRYREYDASREYWFPFAGKLDCGSGKLTGVGGGTDFYCRDTQNTLARNAMIAWGNPASESSLNRPYGFPVRCVKQRN